MGSVLRPKVQGPKGDGGPNATLMTVDVVGSLLRGLSLRACQALLRSGLLRPCLIIIDSLLLLLHSPNTLGLRLCGCWEGRLVITRPCLAMQARRAQTLTFIMDGSRSIALREEAN